MSRTTQQDIVDSVRKGTKSMIDYSQGSGPLCTSEADVLALESQHDDLLAAGKLVRLHLTQCPHGDQKTLDALDRLLKYVGNYHEVTGTGAFSADEVTQPKGEMACHDPD